MDTSQITVMSAEDVSARFSPSGIFSAFEVAQGLFWNAVVSATDWMASTDVVPWQLNDPSARGFELISRELVEMCKQYREASKNDCADLRTQALGLLDAFAEHHFDSVEVNRVAEKWRCEVAV